MLVKIEIKIHNVLEGRWGKEEAEIKEHTFYDEIK